MATNPEGKPSKPAEWEQTLVAEEENPTAPAPEPAPPPPEAPEPAPAEAVEIPPAQAEPAPAPVEEPTTMVEPAVEDEPADEYPSELRRYVRREGSTLILKEPYLPLATRVEIESHVAGRGTKLVERRWLPAKREPVHEIERWVDALEIKPRYQPKAVSWLHRSTVETRRALRGLERVPANIVSKRVVYETEGGLVVEVTYRELGQVLKKYFTVPATGPRAKVLGELKSGSYAQATAVSDDLIDAIARPRGRGHAAARAGMINTWPIRNKHRVEALGLPRRTTKALEGLGIHSTDQLRVRPPLVLARHLGLTTDETQKWTYASELLLLPNMGPAHAKALVQAGVEGLDHLRRTTPARLLERLEPLMKAKRSKLIGVGRTRVTQWVHAAKALRKTKQPFPA